MRPPYPVDLVPLIPEFLTRRRSKFTFALRAIDELGIDRPAFAFVTDLAATDPDGTDAAKLYSPYATVFDQTKAAAAAAIGAGLAEETARGWRITEKGQGLVSRTRRAADEHLDGLALPVTRDDLARLAALLRRGLDATIGSLDPRWHAHIPRIPRMAGDAARPMVALENAVYGLWQARDDCHVAAWREAGLDGPALDILTRIWRAEAASEEDLAAMLPRQTRDDVRRALGRLRDDGLVARSDELGVTEKGGRTRQAIEDETDRLFFGPWPDDVGGRGVWLRDRLAAVNASLAA